MRGRDEAAEAPNRPLLVELSSPCVCYRILHESRPWAGSIDSSPIAVACFVFPHPQPSSPSLGCGGQVPDLNNFPMFSLKCSEATGSLAKKADALHTLVRLLEHETLKPPPPLPPLPPRHETHTRAREKRRGREQSKEGGERGERGERWKGT